MLTLNKQFPKTLKSKDVSSTRTLIIFIWRMSLTKSIDDAQGYSIQKLCQMQQ